MKEIEKANGRDRDGEKERVCVCVWTRAMRPCYLDEKEQPDTNETIIIINNNFWISRTSLHESALQNVFRRTTSYSIASINHSVCFFLTSAWAGYDTRSNSKRNSTCLNKVFLILDLLPFQGFRTLSILLFTHSWLKIIRLILFTRVK